MTSKELHIAAGYFAKITTVKEMRALIVDLPKNIYLKLPEVRLIYELDDEKLNIYKNGSKFETVACPDYAQRYLVAVDITIEMTLRSMDNTLSRAFDKLGEAVTTEEDKKSLVDLILPSKDKKTRHLEYVFQNAMNAFMGHETSGLVPDVVAKGFEIVTERYLKGVK